MALFNRIVAALLALALLLGGLLAAVEIVLAAVGRPAWLVPHDDWAFWLGEQTWDTAVVRAVLIGVLIVGLLLLIPALRRGKPSQLPLSKGTDGVHVTAARRGVEKTLASAARSTSGVSDAKARAGRRKVTVRASTRTRSQNDLQQQVTAAVTERLEQLGLAGRLRPRVTLSDKEAR